MTQTMDLNKMGLMPMEVFEMQYVDGGDTGYYGKGADLTLAAKRIGNAIHQVGDFVRGFWEAIVN